MARYLPSGLAVEGVVRGYRAVGVDPQQLTLKRIHRLGRRAGGLLANGDVEFAVLAEVNRPPLVPGGDSTAELRLVVALQEDFLAIRHCHIANRGETAHAVVGKGLARDVGDVDVPVFREIRTQRHADQAPLPGAVYRNGQEWCVQQSVVFDDAECARLLAQEDTAVGADLHRGRAGDSVGDARPCEALRQCNRAGRAKRFEVGDQVGELRRRDARREHRWHERGIIDLSVLDLGRTDGVALPIGVDDDQAGRRLVPDDSGENLSAGVSQSSSRDIRRQSGARARATTRSTMADRTWRRRRTDQGRSLRPRREPGGNVRRPVASDRKREPARAPRRRCATQRTARILGGRPASQHPQTRE